MDAESLLLATGFLRGPTATDYRAARVIGKEVVAAFTDAIDRESQGRLYAVTAPASYFDKLGDPLDYQTIGPALEAKLGAELAGQYQALQQQGRALLTARHPTTTIDTILGPQVVPNDAESDAQYRLEADTAENHLRLARDFAAGALLVEQVSLWAQLFPTTYGNVVNELRMALAKKAAKQKDWFPPFWLEDSIRTLFQMPFTGELSITGAAPLPPRAPRPSFALKSVIDDIKGEASSERS